MNSSLILFLNIKGFCLPNFRLKRFFCRGGQTSKFEPLKFLKVSFILAGIYCIAQS